MSTDLEIIINKYEKDHERLLKRLVAIKKKLDEMKPEYYIVIKKIKNNPYYYMQWREDDTIKSKSLGRVLQCDISKWEKEIEDRKSLQKEKKELEKLTKIIQNSLNELKKDEQFSSVLAPESYSFEVYWKNELVSRVRVKGKDVYVSRYTKNPVKQLFYSEKMNRHQLNEVFQLRCWEKERGDIFELLNALGIKEYNPSEIVRKTHGVSYNDYIWFRFWGENIRSEDVLVR